MLRARPLRSPAVLSLALLLAAFVAGSVQADEKENQSNTLATPPLTLGTSLSCIVANIGRKQVTLDIEMHDVNGTVVAADRCTLPAGAVNAGGVQCAILQSAPAGFVGYCTFTVLQGDKRDIRAAILSHNANQGLGNVPAALAAQ